MKKIALVLVIFSLILFTAIIKNSAKKNEDKIFTLKENIRILNSELEKIKLEFDYLSSSAVSYTHLTLPTTPYV